MSIIEDLKREEKCSHCQCNECISKQTEECCYEHQEAWTPCDSCEAEGHVYDNIIAGTKKCPYKRIKGSQQYECKSS